VKSLGGRLNWVGVLGIVIVPFVFPAAYVVHYSLSDEPEAYLLFIPLVAFFWMGLLLNRHDLPVRRVSRVALVASVAAGIILFVGLGIRHAFPHNVLLLWPAWTAVVVWAAYGIPYVTRLWAPLLYLYLVWPPIFLKVLAVIDPWLEKWSFAFFNRLTAIFSWLRQTARPGEYAMAHSGHWIVVGITDACSGSDSLMALMVLFPVALILFDASWVRKLGLVVIGTVLAFVENIVRIFLIFLAAHWWGTYWAFAVIHPLLGPVLFAALVLGLMLVGGLQSGRTAARSFLRLSIGFGSIISRGKI